MIPFFLTPEVQGYWYTFGSIAALAVFADLGFTTIVSQFSAHEYARLKLNPSSGELEGDGYYIERISSLFRFVVRWGATVSIAGFPVILLIGIWMFSAKGEEVHWILPWIIYVGISGLNFTAGIVLSFLEGCNQIAKIQKIRFFSIVTGTLVSWTLLISGFDLYTLALSIFISSCLSLTLLYFRFKTLIMQLMTVKSEHHFPWRHDFLKLLWKYAISWTSGYFIFQIYVPLTFANHGSVDAGKVGISMTLATALFAIANVWVYVATPKFNMYASLKEWDHMGRLLRSTLFLTFSTFFLGASVILFTLWLFGDQYSIFKRFLGIIPMTILLASWLIQTIVNALAVYLRAHKQEPLVWISLASALIISVSTLIVSKVMEVEYLFLGFLITQIIMFPFIFNIFQIKRRIWHNVKMKD